MSTELGDPTGEVTTVTKPSDGTNMSAGDAVNVNGSNQVTPTSATGDDFFGIVAGPANDGVDLSSLSSGDEVVVIVRGPCVANVGSSVTENDVLETSGTAGRLNQNSQGTEYNVDDGSLSATSTQDVSSISAGTTATFTVSVSGAATGDPVSVAPPSGINTSLTVTGFVSSSGTVTVVVSNPTSGAIDPSSGDYTVRVHQDSTDVVAHGTPLALSDAAGTARSGESLSSNEAEVLV